MDASQPQSPASGPDQWDAVLLNYAVRELRREFSTVSAERIAHAVDATARIVSPAAGSVVLLQRARERLGSPE